MGVIVEDSSTLPFAVEIIRGAQISAQKLGLNLFISDTESDDRLLNEIISNFRDWKINDIIYISPHHKLISEEMVSKIPSGILDRQSNKPGHLTGEDLPGNDLVIQFTIIEFVAIH